MIFKIAEEKNDLKIEKMEKAATPGILFSKAAEKKIRFPQRTAYLKGVEKLFSAKIRGKDFLFFPIRCLWHNRDRDRLAALPEE